MGWIDELKQRYLAGEGNVVLLHGDVGPALVQGLVDMLGATRQVVGVLTEDGMEFPAFGDQARFEQLVSAAQLMAGSTDVLGRRKLEDTLGRVWFALQTDGTDCAFIVPDAHRFAPGRRRRHEDISGGAPPLIDWPLDPSLRRTNHLVVLLAPSADAIREELVERCITLEVAPEALVPEPAPEPVVAPAELDAAAAEPLPTPVPRTPAAPPAEPAEDLGPALEAAVGRHVVEATPEEIAAFLPVMRGVAEVISARAPNAYGAVALALEEGSVVPTTSGAEAFLARWRGDIALGASASMILGGEETGQLDPTGMRALTRRVGRWLGEL